MKEMEWIRMCKLIKHMWDRINHHKHSKLLNEIFQGYNHNLQDLRLHHQKLFNQKDSINSM